MHELEYCVNCFAQLCSVLFKVIFLKDLSSNPPKRSFHLTTQPHGYLCLKEFLWKNYLSASANAM